MLQNFLLILTSVVFLIGGLIKRNHKMWTAALCGIVLFFTGTALSVSNAGYDSVDHVRTRSEKFQEAANKTAKEFGQAAGEALSQRWIEILRTIRSPATFIRTE